MREITKIFNQNNKQRQSSKRIWLSSGLGVLGISALVWYLTVYSKELYRLRDFSFGDIIVLSLLVLISYILVAVRFKLIVTTFGVHISLLECFALTTGGNLLNFLPLNIAFAFRAFYLKKLHRLKFVEFGLGIGLVFLIGSITAGILGLISFYLLSFENKDLSFTLLLLFLVFIFAPFVVLGSALIYRRKNLRKKLYIIKDEKQNWFTRFYSSLIRSIDVIYRKPKIVLALFAINIVSNIVVGVKFWLIASLLGYSINFLSGLVLQSTYYIVSFFTILPAAIGLKEAVIGAGAKGLGGQFTSGVMISTADRIINMSWIILCGSISLIFLQHRLGQKVFARRNNH